MQVKELLVQYDVNVLKTMAHEHGIDPKGQTKTALVGSLARVFAQRAHVTAGVGRLGPAEREILELLQRSGGSSGMSRLRYFFRDSALFEPSPKRQEWQGEPMFKGKPKYTGKPRLEDAAARLGLLGLAFSSGSLTPNYGQRTQDWMLGNTLEIPGEILALLPPVAVNTKQTGIGEPGRVQAGSARNFQRDLSRYVSFVRRQGKLDVTTQGWLYKKTAAELVAALGWGDRRKTDEKKDPYLFFLRRMLTALGLVSLDNMGQMPPSSALSGAKEKSYWSQPPAERVKTAFQAFMDATAWNELHVIPGAYGIHHLQPAAQPLLAARKVVIDAVKHRAAAGWVALADVIDDIRVGHYEFLFPRDIKAPRYYGYYSPLTPYYNTSNPYGITVDGIQDEAAGWDQVEAVVITHIITGPLHWLGLTDVGLNGDTPIAYRLTPLGAWLLGIGSQVRIAEEGGRIVVQPNFQIVAMEPIAENVLMLLDEFADFQGGDHALTYGLTRESVYRGQRAGWETERIIAYLEEATHVPLPQNVKRSLQEWQALYERITVRRGVSLLQAENGAALDELFADPALAPKLGRRVDADAALPEASPAEVQRALRDKGWLPVVTHPNQTTAPVSIEADAEGNISFVHRTPSIYAFGQVELFAELVDSRHARITPESVAAARRHNLSVPEMVTRLQGVHRGELPPKLVTRLKAWGKYFGDAKLGTVTLMEFQNEATRRELLDDPELKPHLTPFDAGNRPLVLVRADALEQVKQLLAERGVEIREGQLNR